MSSRTFSKAAPSPRTGTRLRWSLTLLLAAVIATACLPAASGWARSSGRPSGPSGTVDGYVHELSGFRRFPSRGATVQLSNGKHVYTATTNHQGYFMLHVPAGVYSTRAFKGNKSGTSWGVRIAAPFATRARVNFTIR